MVLLLLGFYFMQSKPIIIGQAYDMLWAISLCGNVTMRVKGGGKKAQAGGRITSLVSFILEQLLRLQVTNLLHSSF